MSRKIRICHFCHSGIEYTMVQINSSKRFYPICYLCNRDEKHIKNKWELKLPKGWTYKFMEDIFISPKGIPVGRLSFFETSQTR